MSDVDKTTISIVQQTICNSCKENISACDQCLEYLKTDPIYCKNGMIHLCNECYEEEQQLSEGKK